MFPTVDGGSNWSGNLLVLWVLFIGLFWDRRGLDRMVVGFTITSVIIAYHHLSCEFEFRSWRSVLYTVLNDEVYHWLATGRWFSHGNPVSSINKTCRHDNTEMLWKVVLSTITLTILLDFFNLKITFDMCAILIVHSYRQVHNCRD